MSTPDGEMDAPEEPGADSIDAVKQRDGQAEGVDAPADVSPEGAEAAAPLLLDAAGITLRRGGPADTSKQNTKAANGGAPAGFQVRLAGLRLRAGERRALVGPSGSGKSTLFDILSMALRPDAAARFMLSSGNGEADDGAVDVAELWAAEALDRMAMLRAGSFGYVLQTGGLIPFLTVRQNILMPSELIGAPDVDNADRLAGRLGITDQLEKFPAQLSVGQRQRVGIARALTHRPPIVFADEPTASVDPTNAEAIMALFIELVEESGAALLVASHDHDLLARYGLDPLSLSIEQNADGPCSVFGEEA